MTAASSGREARWVRTEAAAEAESPCGDRASGEVPVEGILKSWRT